MRIRLNFVVVVAVSLAVFVCLPESAKADLTAYWPFDIDVNCLNDPNYDGVAYDNAVISTADVKRGTGSLEIQSNGAEKGRVLVPPPYPIVGGQLEYTVVGWYRLVDVNDDGMNDRPVVWDAWTDETANASKISPRLDVATGKMDMEFWINDVGTGSHNSYDGPVIWDNNASDWHHAALVWNRNTDVIRYYHDGELRENFFTWEGFGGPGKDALEATTGWSIGCGQTDSRHWDGYIDDVAVFDEELTGVAILALYEGTFDGNSVDPNNVLDIVITRTAEGPRPAVGVLGVDSDALLMWDVPPDVCSPTYDVYLDTNSLFPGGAVAAGLTEPNYPVSPDMTLATKYYWRVDVNDGNVYTGRLWSFTVRNLPGVVAYWDFDNDYTNAQGDDKYDGLVVGSGVSITKTPGEYKVGTGALKIDDDGASTNYVDIYPAVIGRYAKVFTVAAHFKYVDISGNGSDSKMTFCEGQPYEIPGLAVNSNNGYVYWDTNPPGTDWAGNFAGNGHDGGWHHVAMVFNQINDYIKVYYDGELEVNDVTSLIGDDRTNNNSHGFMIGNDKDGDGVENWDGYIDDVAVWDIEVDASEIAALAGGKPVYATGYARSPVPQSGQTDVGRTPTLTWVPGIYAVKHQVYFGDDMQAVEDANTSSPEYKAPDLNYGNESYSPAGPLDVGKTYYWRIDEVNELHPDVFWKGGVRSFTTIDYVNIVDDMESYDMAGNRIFDTWLDGVSNSTGSFVTLETTASNVHRGGKSMDYGYNNTFGQYYSEADRASPFANWTLNNAKALGLYFKGDPGNATDVNSQMYVGLSDTDTPGNVVVVPYDGDADDIKDATWQHWNIDLEDFNAGGVDLTKVGRIYIGFGDRSNPKAGGTGTVYFDDIRLYPSRCVVDRAYANLAGTDCMIDGKDLDVLVGGWLVSDYNLATVEPNDSNLVGWWKFDEGAGTDANDSSDSNNHGYFTGAPNDPVWVDGIVGPNALLFDGNNTYVHLTNPLAVFGGSLTVSAWVKVPSDASGRVGIVLGDYDEPNGVNINFEIHDEGDMRLYWMSSAVNLRGSIDLRDDSWHLLTWIRDRDANTVKGYVDTVLDIDYSEAIPDANAIVPHYIGRDARAGDTAFEGTIDDVRVYNYAFSHAEVCYLAVQGAAQAYVPLVKEAAELDLWDDEKINLKDYAMVAEFWLQEQVWP